MVYKKQKIPPELKKQVWDKYNNDKYQVYCPCCNIYPIYRDNFECGHIQAEATGGLLTIENLIPICAKCNTSMGTINYYHFKEILDGKRESTNIYEMLKVKVWHNYFGNNCAAKCYCCKLNKIKITEYKCNLIIPRKKGGQCILNNLCPVCKTCSKLLRTNSPEEVRKIGINDRIGCCYCM